jgi:murein DD-endopeptidase MepM/ murein hydrolase activator NlpD
MVMFRAIVAAIITFVLATASVASAQTKPQLVLSAPKSTLQGDVVIVRAGTRAAKDAPALRSVEGALGARPVGFVLDRGGRGPGFIALSGVDPLTAPGAYPLVVTATLANGDVLTAASRVMVNNAGFITESVKISTTLLGTIDPSVSADEEARVRAVYAGFTPKQAWRGVFRQPLQGKVLSKYGNRRIYNGTDLGTYHAGIDFYGLKGRPVIAAAAGEVVFVDALTVRGNFVVIDHGRGVFTAYAHLSKVLVKTGQVVKVGQKIGEVGTTGRSQGNHLHFEVAVGGVSVEPSFWLENALP